MSHAPMQGRIERFSENIIIRQDRGSIAGSVSALTDRFDNVWGIVKLQRVSSFRP